MHLCARCSDISKSAILAIQYRGLTRHRLKPRNRHIAITRINFHRVANALGSLRCDDRRAAAAKGFVNHIAGFAIVQHRAAHAFHWLLRAMHRRHILIAGADRPERRLIARALPMTGGTLADAINARLMLPMIIATPEHKARLSPNNLAAHDKARRF